jgi:hypothetical protein
MSRSPVLITIVMLAGCSQEPEWLHEAGMYVAHKRICGDEITPDMIKGASFYFQTKGVDPERERPKIVARAVRSVETMSVAAPSAIEKWCEIGRKRLKEFEEIGRMR